MDNNDYDAVVENLPDDWYKDDELKVLISQAYLDQVKNLGLNFDIEVQDKADISRLLELLAEQENISFEQVEANLIESAHFVARLQMFEIKFPHVVQTFPENAQGDKVFPDVILAKLFQLAPEDAKAIAESYWGISAGTLSEQSDIDIN